MTRTHQVRVHRSEDHLAKSDQLAWKIAQVATDDVHVDDDVVQMVINRIIDNAAVAAASLLRPAPSAARAQALTHTASAGGAGATVVGVPPTQRASIEWASWANSVAVRELDYHDTFLAAEYSHPGDNIPPLIAVAQHAASRGLTGRDLLRGIVTGYEVQVDLARTMSLHRHKIDHVAHLGPSVAAGIGALLGLDTEVIFHAIGQALHVTTATRQSRKGQISSWKAYAPAFAGKMAIEAIDRAMRGQTSPTPIWEGEDGVIAWLLDGPSASYDVTLPAPGEPKRAILDTWTKEHSAEYQAQAWIDLAERLHATYPEVYEPDRVTSILLRTSQHTHNVIGSGARDPQKYSPDASRETLDHSLPYIFAVALQDGGWDHDRSYSPDRSHRHDTVELWHKISTIEDADWTRRYHSLDPTEQAFGGAIEVRLADGSMITDQIAVADAHPLGARPFARDDYIRKFHALTTDALEQAEIDRFVELVERLPELTADEMPGLTVVARPGLLDTHPDPMGLF